MSPFLRFALLAMGSLAALGQGVSSRRAMLIGVSEYRFVPALDGPQKDVDLLAAALRKADFEVTRLLEPTATELNVSIRAFSKQIKDGDVVLVYYSGHGVQVAGENYLLPTDFRVPSQGPVDFSTRALPMSLLIKELNSSVASTQIVILDACRDNPIGRQVAKAQSGWAAVTIDRNIPAAPDRRVVPSQRPIAGKVFSNKGTLIAFATAPGSTATDSGIYGRSLAVEIVKPGVRVEEVFRAAHSVVQSATSGKQTPWISASAMPSFYFIEKDRETIAWEQVDKTLPGELRMWLTRNPDSRFNRDAQALLNGLEEQEWSKVNKASPASLSHFLSLFPEGVYANEAKSQLKGSEAEEAWAAVDKQSAEELRKFRERFPLSPRNEEAARLIRAATAIDEKKQMERTCTRAWSAVDRDSDYDLRKFMKKYSSCDQVGDAEDRLRELAAERKSNVCQCGYGVSCYIQSFLDVGGNCYCDTLNGFGVPVRLFGKVVKVR